MALGRRKFVPDVVIIEPILTPDGLCMDFKKFKKILNFKIPSNCQELRGILGVVMFLTKFCLELASWSYALSEVQGETEP